MIDEKVLIERLEEERGKLQTDRWASESNNWFGHYENGIDEGYENAIEIAKELSSEYNNGWIPCSERLPGINGKYLVTCKDIPIPQIRFFDFDDKWDSIHAVIAWQPLPPVPYKKGE